MTTKRTYSGVLGDSRCECHDPHCHDSQDQCTNVASMILYRVDMEDVTGTAFCDSCGEDAMESGLFTDETDNDSEDDDNGWPYDAAKEHERWE